MIEVHKRTGYHYRPDTWDRGTIRGLCDYDDLDFKDQVVLDIGGHCGFFARRALERGAKRVMSVEPFPGNIELWQRNLKHLKPASLVAGAAVSDQYEHREIDLYINTGINHGLHSIQPIRGRGKISVPAVRWADIMKRDKFTVLKMDIEGGEYTLMPELAQLPKSIKQLAMELHFGRDERRASAALILESLEKQGFTEVRAPVMNNKAWATVGVWRR